MSFELDKELYLTIYNIGLIYEKKGDMEKAVAKFQEFESKTPLLLGKLSAQIAIKRIKTPEIFEGNRGLFIRSVVKDSQAEIVGLKGGDVIIEYAGKGISSEKDLDDAKEKTKSKKEISLIVIRDDERKEFKLKPGTIGVHTDEF